MMFGEHIQSNRTVQIPQWDPTEDLTVSVHSPYSSHSPPGLANGTGAGDYLASLYRYLPSNEPDSLFAAGESDPEIAVDEIWCDDFRMYVFKVKKCARGRSHDWTECPFAHPGEKARRRDPHRFQYSGTPCPDFRKGACKKGEACEYAHGVFECWLHPDRYRTQPCKDGLNCSRRICFFAHTPEQLRTAPQQSPWSPTSAESDFGSPIRHSFDAYFTKNNNTFGGSNFTPPSLSPPSESPPMSPSRSQQFTSGSPQSVSDLVASMRGLGLGKMQLSPRGNNGVSGFGSPRRSNLRPGCNFNLMPASPVSVGGFDIWETPEEEPAMERVESGRDLRARMYAKLSRENSLG